MNRTFSLPFFIFLVVLFTAGCSGRAVHKKLDHIEAFAAEYPDSARRVLDAMDRDLLDTPKLRARHALMLSTALSRCKVVVPDDSLINIAVNYYRIHGPQKEKFLAYYYQGRVYDALEDYESAMRSYIEAESIRSKDIPLRHLTSLQLKKGDIYTSFLAYDEAISAYSKAETYAQECGWTNNHVSAILGKIKVYLLIPDFNKADSCFAELSPLTGEMSTTKRKDYSNFRLQYLRLTEAPKDSTLRLAKEFEEEYGDKGLSWSSLALVYLNCGDFASAEHALEQYHEQVDTELEEAQYDLILSKLKDSLHQYKESLEAFKRFYGFFSQTDYDRLKSDTKYVEKKAYQKKKENRYLRWILIDSVAFVLLASILIVRLRKSKKEQKEIDALYAEMKEEQDNLMAVLQGNAELQENARTALGKRVTAIGQFLAADRPSSLDRVSDQLENLTENRKELLDTIGMLYAIYHPDFVSKLMEKNLSTTEIGFCCLLQLGFRTGEIGDVINRSSTYNISSAIRQKLGLGPRDTNLSIFIKDLYRSSSE